MALNSCLERRGERKEGERQTLGSFAGGIVSCTKPKVSEDGEVSLQVVSFLSGEVCERGQ